MGKRAESNGKLGAKAYEKELRKLQEKLCKLQDWVRHNGMRVVVIFEGRDGAGKGGRSARSPSGSARGSSASSRFPPPPTARSPRSTCSATWRISPPPAKS